MDGSPSSVVDGATRTDQPSTVLVSALAQCHMLWFPHLASAAGVVVVGYEDQAVGTMRIEAAGQGQFREVVLRPRVTVAAGAHLPTCCKVDLLPPEGASGTDPAEAGSRSRPRRRPRLQSRPPLSRTAPRLPTLRDGHDAT